MPRALIAVVLLALAGSAARANLVDRVVAFVDDEVILLSELRVRAEPELRMDTNADPLTVHRRVLDRMIDHRLVEREATRLQVTVTDAELRSTVAELQRRNGLDEHQWARALDEQGWTAPLYEDVLREQMLRAKVLQLRRVGVVEPVSDQEVRAEWERRAAAFEPEPRFRLAQLTEPLREGASPELRTATLTAFERRVARVRAGERTLEEEGGTRVGWVLAAELPERTRAVLAHLEPGEVSEVQQTEAGFSVVQLLERGETEPEPFAGQEESIRQELNAERDAKAKEEVMAELRSSAMIVRRL